MRTSLRTALLLVAVILPACEPYQGIIGPLPRTVASAVLRGSQVIPAVGTGATGTATVTVAFNLTYFDYSVDQTGIVTPTAVEIRLGGPGTNGPVLFTLPLGTFPIGGRIQDPGFFSPAGTVTSFAGALNEISAGNTYVLISSAAFPTGEVRGHLGGATLASAQLSGGQEVAPISPSGTGTATMVLDDAQAVLSVTVNVSGLTGITGAQIFDGKPGTSGSAPLFIISSAAFSGSASATLGAGDFTPSSTAATFADAINALLSGLLYVQVLTGGHPTGEIRGQVGPTQLNASLTSADVVPPNTSTATGSATLALSALQDGFFIMMTHTVSAADRVNLDAEAVGANGPTIFDIDAAAGAATSPLSATVGASQLIPNIPANLLNFGDAVNAMMMQKTYVEVGNQSFPSGEIRGQLLP